MPAFSTYSTVIGTWTYIGTDNNLKSGWIQPRQDFKFSDGKLINVSKTCRNSFL